MIHHTDICIIGAGLSGLACAYEPIDRGKKIILIDRDIPERMGGLAKESFGGIMLVDTPYQRKFGIKDSASLAYQDWESYAEFGENDFFPKAWAKEYCERSVPEIMEWIHHKKIKFLSIVNWPERGWDKKGNSVPRWHITWGTGKKLIDQIIRSLKEHPNYHLITFLHQHRVDDFEKERVFRVYGENESLKTQFSVHAEQLVLASGGISGGNLEMVRKYSSPSIDENTPLLNGSHSFAEGKLHFAVQKKGGVLTHMNHQWHYAAGIAHPQPKKFQHGISLVPPRSALWVDATGKRFSPPLVGNTDTSHLVNRVLETPHQYSWMILNKKIFLKELAVSGSEYMKSFIDQSYFHLIKDLLLGNHRLWQKITSDHPDVLLGNSVKELSIKMNRLAENALITEDLLLSEMKNFDTSMLSGEDLQRQYIHEHRKYFGDRIRLCKSAMLLDEKAFPLVAIRCRVISRKSLGGILTDLDCRVLDDEYKPIDGLFAVGEAAGFGGGGIHGKRSLEGTFLGSCILTGRKAGKKMP